MGEPLKGYYYAAQLLQMTRPKKHEFFRVEKFLGEKKIKGIEYVLVKYLHYGPKFNRWIKKSNVIEGVS